MGCTNELLLIYQNFNLLLLLLLTISNCYYILNIKFFTSSGKIEELVLTMFLFRRTQGCIQTIPMCNIFEPKTGYKTLEITARPTQ